MNLFKSSWCCSTVAFCLSTAKVACVNNPNYAQNAFCDTPADPALAAALAAYKTSQGDFPSCSCMPAPRPAVSRQGTVETFQMSWDCYPCITSTIKLVCPAMSGGRHRLLRAFALQSA